MRHDEQAIGLKTEFVSTRHLLLAAMLLVISAVLAVIGPFNTFGSGNFAWRLFYWGGLVVSSVMLSSLVQLGIARLALQPVILREAFTICVFSLSFTPIVILWTDALLVENHQQMPSPWTMLLYVTSICVCLSALRYGGPELLRMMVHEEDGAIRTAPPPPPPPPPPRLERRLPEGFSGDILRLSGSGHYVNVITTQGQFDLRIRLGDAVGEMDTCDGLWVHRSHWVARAAVARAEPVKGRARLVLRNGDIVPVGAKYMDQLEAAGIL